MTVIVEIIKSNVESNAHCRFGEACSGKWGALNATISYPGR